MSVTAMAWVWSLPCPQETRGLPYRSNHKFVLLAYADHADHQGRNIYPAVHTIVVKTGLGERTVQRLTRELAAMGLLVEDGKGPRGTIRWSLPMDEGGATVTPRQPDGGARSRESLGAIPSGANPSCAAVTPESIKPEPERSESEDAFLIHFRDCFAQTPGGAQAWRRLEEPLGAAQFERTQGRLVVRGLGALAEICQERYARTLERYLTGALAETVTVEFLTEEATNAALT